MKRAIHAVLDAQHEQAVKAYTAACLERDRLIYAEIPMLEHRCEEAFRLLREHYTKRKATA
jgi:hypothetical protein